MDYRSYELFFTDVFPWRDIAISEMAELGFESFSETKTGVLGYIQVLEDSEEIFAQVKSLEGVDRIEVNDIVTENWNQKWEDNFDPVYVDTKLAIVAPFHADFDSCDMTIVIQPQMSFGTGHHQTTWLISKRLFDLELEGKEVMDMGTGTGVLAILAEKLGGKNIFAPDIDEWSYKNALENAERNECQEIEVAHGGHELVRERTFDIVIANINKNILIENFSVYSRAVRPQGTLILSGFFKTDKDELVACARKYGFVFEVELSKDEWSMLEFKRN
ncbi:MAG: 50S ribosomal protein L11 methyltransferase [Crocinitomicaceae bacterium]|nr:50S ribosomal protein L11 methyltransferase [Crocinitomicaceae bacterium]